MSIYILPFVNVALSFFPNVKSRSSENVRDSLSTLSSCYLVVPPGRNWVSKQLEVGSAETDILRRESAPGYYEDSL